MTTKQVHLRETVVGEVPRSTTTPAAHSLEPQADRFGAASNALPAKVTLSLVIPCYNEEKTLETCVEKVLAIKDETLDLELIIVDDCSKDGSLAIGRALRDRIPGLVLL